MTSRRSRRLRDGGASGGAPALPGLAGSRRRSGPRLAEAAPAQLAGGGVLPGEQPSALLRVAGNVVEAGPAGGHHLAAARRFARDHDPGRGRGRGVRHHDLGQPPETGDVRSTPCRDVGRPAVRTPEPGLGAPARFRDPQAPWQKGLVETINGRARRGLPRDTDVLTVMDRAIGSLRDRLLEPPSQA